jgi:tRNA(Arg) A34 adenosine deaminase TadA
LRSGLVPADHGVSLTHLPLIDAGAAARSSRWARPGLTAALEGLIARGPGRADDVGWMELALELAGEVDRSGIDPASGRSDRPIAAVLVGPENGLLAWATHRGSRNAMRHAEINLVEDWLARTRSGLPRGATLYATLKPCRACAGLIWDAALDPRTLRVLYAADDPGRVARETVLDAGSAERRRAVASVEEARLHLSWQLHPGRPSGPIQPGPVERAARLTAHGARA